MSTAAIELSRRETDLVALSDEALVTRIYELVREIEDPLSDEFYWYLGEAFERFAPDAEWQHRFASYTPAERPSELGALRESMAARAAARWMARSVV
jgi:hypothetical protein